MRDEEMTAETIKKQMIDDEWQKVYEMSLDKSLYNLPCMVGNGSLLKSRC
jgi:DNA replication licensing factor MCM6